MQTPRDRRRRPAAPHTGGPVLKNRPAPRPFTRLPSAALAFAVAAALCGPLTAGEEPPADPTLKEIAAQIDTYRNKRITLVMRLKYYEERPGRIAFYDENNHDIHFRISSREDRKRLAGDIKCAHEGLRYRVTFLVTGKSSLETVEGTLDGFRPLFLEKIPWGP